jgi:tetratricopeptide (TPR) repeat protein
MPVPLVAALILVLTVQSPQTDRTTAEQLARSGQTVEALALFERVVAQNPTDLEARGWIARLQLRLGRSSEAEAGFRAILLQKPEDIDARIGLAMSLNRRNAWRESLPILLDVEKVAGENAELFAALARTYRRAGDDQRAVEYYKRAIRISPDDPDILEGYEATVRAIGNAIEIEGLAEGGISDARSGSFTGSFRVAPRLLLEGIIRAQNRDDVSDLIGGGGGILRVNRTTNFSFRAGGGAHNVSLPNADVTMEVRTYRGPVELGFNYRYLSFTDANVSSFSPILAWDTGTRWRFAARYTYSASTFQATGQSSGDHSALVRETVRLTRRLDTTVTYAYGIESFEDLTADRIGNLGGHTIAASLRLRMPSVTTLAATWEHQWRSDDRTLDRVTLLFVQRFR